MNKLNTLAIAALVLLTACTSKTTDNRKDSLNSERNLVTTPKISAPETGAQLAEAKGGAMYDGDTTERYANGVIKIKGTMGGGKRQGSWVAFFQDGAIQSECGYRDGMAHGLSVVYRENGTKIWSGQYNNGKQVGIWKYYDEQGKWVAKNYKGDLPK